MFKRIKVVVGFIQNETIQLYINITSVSSCQVRSQVINGVTEKLTSERTHNRIIGVTLQWNKAAVIATKYRCRGAAKGGRGGGRCFLKRVRG